jgi:hypothetical protein
MRQATTAWLIYKGLIPTRDEDQFGAVFACGNFSEFNQANHEADNRPVQLMKHVGM